MFSFLTAATVTCKVSANSAICNERIGSISCCTDWFYSVLSGSLFTTSWIDVKLLPESFTALLIRERLVPSSLATHIFWNSVRSTRDCLGGMTTVLTAATVMTGLCAQMETALNKTKSHLTASQTQLMHNKIAVLLLSVRSISPQAPTAFRLRGGGRGQAVSHFDVIEGRDNKGTINRVQSKWRSTNPEK